MTDQACHSGQHLDDEPENAWLISCAVRFDGCAFAESEGLPDQPYHFVKMFMARPDLTAPEGYLMTAMFMLQRRLMKEGVESKQTQAWRIFRELFLKLCDKPIPHKFRGSGWKEWQDCFVPILAQGRSIVEDAHSHATYSEELGVA